MMSPIELLKMVLVDQFDVAAACGSVQKERSYISSRMYLVSVAAEPRMRTPEMDEYVRRLVARGDVSTADIIRIAEEAAISTETVASILGHKEISSGLPAGIPRKPTLVAAS